MDSYWLLLAIVTGLAAGLMVIPMNMHLAHAQDMVVGSISTTTAADDDEEESNSNTTGPQNYQDVERAEVIDNDGNIQNPGGLGNENIDIETESMTRETNLAETVLPPSTIQSQEYQDMKISLQAAGYSISDMQYTLAFRTDTPMVIVRGLEGVPTQPNLMDLESIGAAYGYILKSHVFIGGAWETIYESATTTAVGGGAGS